MWVAAHACASRPSGSADPGAAASGTRAARRGVAAYGPERGGHRWLFLAAAGVGAATARSRWRRLSSAWEVFRPGVRRCEFQWVRVYRSRWVGWKLVPVEAGCLVLRLREDPAVSHLKKSGSKIIDLWKFHNTPASEMIVFTEVIMCLDASTASELTDENSLSAGLISKVGKEIDYLEKSKVLKLKNKYMRKKNKILKLIKESHLLPSQFNLDPKELVPSDFAEATAKLKTVMDQVKELSLARKHIVMRTEFVLEYVGQSLCAKTAGTLLEALRSMLTSEDEFQYDGKDIKIVLNEAESRIKANLELPVKKRASARLRDQANTKGDTAELPARSYPAGIRGGHRTHPNQTWGKGSRK